MLEEPWKNKEMKKKQTEEKPNEETTMVVSDFIYPLSLRVHFFVSSLQFKS